MAKTAQLIIDGKTYEFPLVEGSEGEVGVDISDMLEKTGAVTLDFGYKNTGATKSAITFLDGEKGILRYRGYPIEDLAENSARPSMRPTSPKRSPSTFARNSGTRCVSISLATSRRKLASDRAQTLRGRLGRGMGRIVDQGYKAPWRWDHPTLRNVPPPPKMNAGRPEGRPACSMSGGSDYVSLELPLRRRLYHRPGWPPSTLSFMNGQSPWLLPNGSMRI